MGKVTDLTKHKNTIPGAAAALQGLANLAKEGKLRACVVVALEHGEDESHNLYFTEGSALEQIWVMGALTHAQTVVASTMARSPASVDE